MISATMCRLNALVKIDEYCSKCIEPLLLEANGQTIHYGKYNASGTTMYYISKTYAKDKPCLEAYRDCPVSPFDIKTFLEACGYTVEWIHVKEYYSAGYSSSGRTKYYDTGYNTYYTLKISC